MIEAPRPYIGVTGITEVSEVNHLVTTFEQSGVSRESSHQPMIGFLVSHDTLNGVKIVNKRYPDFNNIPQLLKESKHFAFNTIHYSTEQQIDLGNQIEAIYTGAVYSEGLCHGLQLNIPWPPPDQLVQIRRLFPNMKVILQLSEEAISGRTPNEIVKILKSYQSLIDYALIDPSAGRGKTFRTEDILPYYLAISGTFTELGIGLAGGFTGENVKERIQGFIEMTGTRNISIDAEGGLRDRSGNDFGQDVYNPNKVERYIQNTAESLL